MLKYKSTIVYTSDGSRSKIFNPGWVGSIFCGLAWVGSGQSFMGSVGIWKISPKNVNFFPFGSKKISSGQVRKYPGQRQVCLLLTAGQK